MVTSENDSEVSLADAYKVERDGKVKERILMISLLDEGKTTYEVAELLHCVQSKVAYWKKRYELEGIEGLKTKKQPGRPPKVPREKMEKIRQTLDQGEWWTAKAVRELILKEGGVLYSERQVQRLLHIWGYDLIRPSKKHVNKASRKEAENFKKKPEKPSWKQKRRTGTWSVKTNP